MRNLLALFGALVIAFGGIGWYMGWYQVHIGKTSDGNLRVETEVDTQKVTQDSGTALRQVGSFVGNNVDKVKQEAQAGQTPATGDQPAAAQQPTPGTTPAPAAPDSNSSQKSGIRLFGHNLFQKSDK